MEIRQVTPNVYVALGLPGCNPGLVKTSQGIVLTDSPFRPTDAVQWRKEVLRLGEVRYLVNTEPHADHCTGNGLLPGIGVAHQGIREVLLTRTLHEIEGTIKELDPAGLALMKEYQLKPPAITFSHRLSLHLGEHTFELLHLPGHTSSQTAVYVPEEKVVFTGDNVVHKVKTWTQQSEPYKWLRSLEAVSQLPVDVIVPGHGLPVYDKSYLKEQARIIRRWIRTVRQAIKQGLTQAETAERVRLSPPDPYPSPGRVPASYIDKVNIERLYKLWAT